MRACFIEPQFTQNLAEGAHLEISGDRAHHLLKVIRLKAQEQLMLLDGAGTQLLAEVSDLDKKSLAVKVLKKQTFHPTDHLHLYVGIVDKDAMEEVFRQSVELGFSSITPLITKYSEQHFDFSERHQRIFESALIQSNNPFFPKVLPAKKFENFMQEIIPSEQYFYFSSHTKKQHVPSQLLKANLIIGPEGGFSSEEESLLNQQTNIFVHQFPSAILRTPTAVCAAAGFLFSRFNILQSP